jgi:GT2 family glycosyltransferase
MTDVKNQDYIKIEEEKLIINNVEPNNPQITICIVNYNGLPYLKNCLDSIKRSNYHSGKIETIIADNASSDNSISFLRTNYPWVNVLALDRNYGFARANNICAENAAGEYIVFLNNDTEVTPDWLGELLDTMEKDKNVGIAGSKILLLDTPDKINSAGANITFFGGGYDIGFRDDDSEKYNIAGDRGCVCAATMIVRRDEFLSFGGFDEDYFMYVEDVDLCWRYWLYGKRVKYVPGSVVYHKFGGTSGTFRHAPLRVFYGTRNSLITIIKNYSLYNIPFPLFFSFFYHILRTLYYFVKLDFRLVLSMIKAYCSLIGYLPKILTRRREIQGRRKVRDSYLFKNSVITPFSTVMREFLRLLKN